MPQNRSMMKVHSPLHRCFQRLAFVGFGLSVLQSAQALPAKPYPYRVMPGESLSTILYRFNIAPIYGAGRKLEKTLEMNPKLAARKGEVQSGEMIFLPAQEGVPPTSASPEILSPQTTEAPVESTPPASPIQKMELASLSPQPDTAENGFSELEFSLSESFLKVDSERLANGATSSLGSKPSTTAGLTFRPHLSDENFLEFGASLQRISLSDAPNRTIENQNQNYIRVFGGFVRRFGQRLQLGLRAGQNEELFYRAVSTESVRVEKVGVGFANLNARYLITDRSDLRWYAQASLGLHFAFNDENFQGSTGTHYGLGLEAEKSLGSFVLSSAISYAHDLFPMQSFHFARSELGLKIGFHYLFGGVTHENAP